MGSDRARISYDKSRQYRAVVMQQGRVTVEADWNEAWQIAGEEVRKQVLDIVGPSGTPDDGYLVGPVTTPNEPYDFSVGKGTMYVGGLRAYLPKPIAYSNQAEWLNSVYDSDWVDPSREPTENEFVYLFLQEQEVSAVEDTALLEVALGGPDTAQRVRLVQRIKRLPTSASDCTSALTDAIQHWRTEGFTFDPATMRLLPRSILHASFQPVSSIADPCEPQSSGGYLGADNQLIRIQISNYDQKTQTYSLVWGFDNASFIYRVTVDADEQSIALQSKPIDDFHMLTNDQVVELLPKAMQPDPKDTTNYIAATTGLIAHFDVVDAQHIRLTSPLPTSPIDLSQADVVFLRVWQGQITSTLGNAVTLGTTGLQVAIQTTNGIPLPIGAYWSIAVRPSTPTHIYPARYINTPQSPDGPRIWVCPLAVIGWGNQGTFQLLADCRNHFDNLVNLTDRGGCCCDETVSGPDANAQGTSSRSDLQSIIDRFAGRTRQQSVTICLKPGIYKLSSPLVIGPQQSNLVLEGCGEPIIIQCATGSEKKFQDGLVILNQANNITFKGITFIPPATQFFLGKQSAIAGLGIKALQQLIKKDYQVALEELFVSIGIRVLSCNQLTIKNCIFQLPLTTFCVGIFASGTCQGFIVQENQFIAQTDSGKADQLLHQYNAEFVDQVKQRYNVQIDESLLENYEQKVITQIVSTENTPSEKQIASTTEITSVGQIMPKPILASPFGNNLFGCLFAPTTILSGKAVQDDIQVVETIKESLGSLLSVSKVIARGEGSVLIASLQDAFFLDNRFIGLTAAALIDASIGAITMEQNIVQQCSAGFYLLSSRTLAFTPFRNTVREFDLTTIQALVSWMENTQLTPLIQFSSVLARGYPLPQVFDRSLATPFTSANANPSTFPFSPSELQAIRVCLENIVTLFGQEKTTLSAPPQTISPTIDFNTLHILLSITESLVFSQATNQNTPRLALQISDNTIDAFLVNSQGGATVAGASHTALLVWDDLLSTESSITMRTNTLRNTSMEPTAFLLNPVFCTITGNIFLNHWQNSDQQPSGSLVFVPGPVGGNTVSTSSLPLRVGVAVTGNVFQGRAILPNRMIGNVGSPINTWAFLNTEI